MFGKLCPWRNGRKMTVVQMIIWANVFVWLLLFLSGVLFGNQDPIRTWLTLDLTALKQGRWWEFLTYMWVHADPLESPTMGLLHILFNMATLWMFGRIVEMELGKLPFLALYLVSGVLAAGTFFLEAWLKGKLAEPYVYLHPEAIVGASGAVMGVVAAFSILRPNAKLMIFLIPYPVKAKWAMLGFLGISLILVFVPLLGFIGHSAHIGGAIVGYIWIGIWLKFAPKVSGKETVLFVDTSSGAPVMEYIFFEEVQAVFHKVSESGMESLSPRERSIFQYFSEKASQ